MKPAIPIRTALPRHQQGIALVVALLVVTIVTVMALMFTERQQLWMRQLENRNGFTLATTSIFSAINMARLTLRDDARANQADYPQEAWTMPIPPIAVEDGHIAGQLTDLNGRFNLTNLLPASTSTVITGEEVNIVRAAKAFGISANELAKFLKEYQSIRKLEPASNPELTELLQRVTLSPNAVEQLTKHTVVLPTTTTLNVNFADAESLQASISGLTSGDASALVTHRASEPFMKLEDFQAALPEKLRNSFEDGAVAVQSTYFLVKIEAWFNNVHLEYGSLLYRSGTELPTIIWTRRGTQADS
jgi:general secretion pathway protein K